MYPGSQSPALAQTDAAPCRNRHRMTRTAPLPAFAPRESARRLLARILRPECIMDFAKLTQMSRQAVTDAQNTARRLNHNEVDTWHLLSALLAQENGIV